MLKVSVKTFYSIYFTITTKKNDAFDYYLTRQRDHVRVYKSNG